VHLPHERIASEAIRALFSVDDLLVRIDRDRGRRLTARATATGWKLRARGEGVNMGYYKGQIVGTAMTVGAKP